MHKWVMVTLFVAACAMAIVFSITKIDPDAGEEVVADDVLQIAAVNWAFDEEEYRVPLGSTMTVALKDKEGFHGIGIDEYGIDITGSETVEVTFDQAGEFRIYCSLLCGEGHDTMVSKLIVE